MKRKNFARRSFSILLAAALVMSLSVTAFAAGSSVTFENGKVTAFATGSVYSDTDLFGNFKGVMPGDTRTETVTVVNKASDCDYIKVYLRAVPHDDTKNPITGEVLAEITADERRGETAETAYMEDFLNQLSLTVKKGAQTSSDGAGSPAKNVYLGKLAKGESLRLNMELSVPIELDNEYSDRIGEADWVFVIEGFKDTLIQTGQLNWPIPVMGVLGLALIAYGVIVMSKKRKNERA